VTGADGNLWFTSPGSNRIGRITPLGRVDSFDGARAGVAGPSAITVGSDGHAWFTNTNDRIGRISPDGEIETYDASGVHVRTPFGITSGPEGNVWFTSLNSDRIGFVRPAALEVG
jgi:virginiamycin B lyase